MTNALKTKLKRKLIESRTRLAQEQPFFAVLLMYLNYVADEKIKSASVNGKCIFFNPKFLDKLYPTELDFLLCHLTLHIVFGHIWREQDLQTDTYHHACDIAVNSLLEKYDYKQKRFPHLGTVFRKPYETVSRRDFNAESIYYSLPYSLESLDEKTKSRFLFDSDLRWGNTNFIGRKSNVILYAKDEAIENKTALPGCKAEKNKKEAAGVGIPLATVQDNGDNPFETEEDIKQAWESRVKFAKKMEELLNGSKGFGTGDLPGYEERSIGKSRKSLTDWKSILESFIQEQINDYSFMPPDRRLSESDIFLPDFNEKDTVVKDVLFMIDTSGSFSDDMIASAYAETASALEQFNGKLTGKIGFFDTEIYSVRDFSTVSDIRKIIPFGGGGTDFRPIFDYVYNKMNNELSSLIIITDGEAPFPENTSHITYPVLWLINNERITPPFGKTVRIPLYNDD